MLPPLLTTTDESKYSLYLQEKVDMVQDLIRQALQENGMACPEAEIHPSLPKHYRMRAEFAIYHRPEDDGIEFVMYEPGSKPRKMIRLTDFPGCTVAINDAMTAVRTHLPKYDMLKKRLFEADFLCNQKGDVVIALAYHKKLDADLWMAQAEAFRNDCSSDGLSCSITAHARKQKLVCGEDHVIETIKTHYEDIKLKQVEGTFSQPNATACTEMLNFAISCCENQKEHDLIELYCGSGTFTIALAPYFRKVFATEVSRVPTETALFNIELNKRDNVKLARLSALEVTEALNHVREFFRLKQQEINLDDYSFKTLLIDPPRAGLQDEEALKFTASYDRIIYISCGPESLASDLKYLTKTHKVTRLAFFDQFPYTHHLESGVLLERK